MTSPLVMPSVHRCRFAIFLVYQRWLSGLRVLLPFCNLSLVPFGSWYFLLTVATPQSSSTSAPERLIGIFWTTRRNFSRLLTLYSQLQCTALTFVFYIGDCDHPVARACRGKKNTVLTWLRKKKPRCKEYLLVCVWRRRFVCLMMLLVCVCGFVVLLLLWLSCGFLNLICIRGHVAMPTSMDCCTRREEKKQILLFSLATRPFWRFGDSEALQGL